MRWPWPARGFPETPVPTSAGWATSRSGLAPEHAADRPARRRSSDRRRAARFKLLDAQRPVSAAGSSSSAAAQLATSRPPRPAALRRPRRVSSLRSPWLNTSPRSRIATRSQTSSTSCSRWLLMKIVLPCGLDPCRSPASRSGPPDPRRRSARRASSSCGIVQHGLRQPEPLEHALGVFLHRRLPPARPGRPMQQRPRRRRISAADRPLRLPKIFQGRVARVMPGYAVVLGQVADLWRPRGCRRRPSSAALPPVARTMPSSTLISVVLPAPLGPSRPKISPRPTVTETPCKASMRRPRASRRGRSCAVASRRRPATCSWLLRAALEIAR